MTIFTKILTSAKIGKIYGKRYDYHRESQSFIGYERHKTFPRSVKISAVFFSAPSGSLVTVGCHVLLSLMSCATVIRHLLACLWQSPLLQRGRGRESPGCNCKYTSLAFKKTWLSPSNSRSE